MPRIKSSDRPIESKLSTGLTAAEVSKSPSRFPPPPFPPLARDIFFYLAVSRFTNPATGNRRKRVWAVLFIVICKLALSLASSFFLSFPLG